MKHIRQIKIILVANLFLIFILAACTPASESEYQSSARDNSRSITDEQLPNVLGAYFSARLKDDAYADLGKDLFYEAGEISSYRKKTWDAWKTANNGFAEKKLPTAKTVSYFCGNDYYVTSDEWVWDKNLGNQYQPTVPRPEYIWTLPALSGEPQFDAWLYYVKVGNASKYPLTLYMHGSNDDREGEWNTALGNLKAIGGNIFFIPKGPDGSINNKWFTKPKQKMFQKLMRLSMLGDTIDNNKLFIAGFSEGAYGTQRMASFYADYLAGAEFLSGGEPLINAPPENLANIFFYIREGSLDDGYGRVTIARETNSQLNTLEVNHSGLYKHYYWEELGVSHSDVNVTTGMTELYQKASARNPHPQYVYWENFEMDGTKRDGFYNLRVLEKSTSSADPSLTEPGIDSRERTCYEMSIGSGNTIELNVQNVKYAIADTDSTYGTPTKFNKSYSAATRGKVRIYLHESLVDLTNPVSVTVKGAQTHTYTFTPELSIRHMAESIALFYDSERVFPAAVDVEIR